MIWPTIGTINERLNELLPLPTVQTNTIGIPVFDQAEKAISLMLLEGQSRLTIDSFYSWQSVHLTDGADVAKTSTWGSFNESTYNVKFVLLGRAYSNDPVYKSNAISVALNALKGVGHVKIDDWNDRTLEVITQYWGYQPDTGHNYDPSMSAFAIRYHIEGVEQEDLDDLNSLAEVVLPLVVPEPVSGPKGDPGPPGKDAINPGGTGYRHVQSVPANVWHVAHNLGYNPAGIIVYDSAGDQWFAYTVDYKDPNNLDLIFGTAVFGGTSYLS